MSTTDAEDVGEGNPSAGRRDGEGWTDDRWEYRPLHIGGDVSRLTATVRLAIQAEFSGWELARVRLYPGNVRKVVLRRKRTHPLQPELSF